MKTLIVYDSKYGNTEQIARAIGETLEARVLRPDQAAVAELREYDLLIVGSPTQGGRPTTAIRDFIASIPAGGLRDIDVAAFDTRLSPTGQNVFLKLLMRVIGFAAGKIATGLQAKGGRLVAPAEGFAVEGTEGPLAAGELERARTWARRLVAATASTPR